jgi:hypothetical protein
MSTVVLGERHLRHVLLSYKDYYNTARTHLSLNKDAPVPRGVEWVGNIVCRLIRRTAPSIWPDVIFDRHRRPKQRHCAQGDLSARTDRRRARGRWQQI